MDHAHLFSFGDLSKLSWVCLEWRDQAWLGMKQLSTLSGSHDMSANMTAMRRAFSAQLLHIKL